MSLHTRRDYNARRAGFTCCQRLPEESPGPRVQSNYCLLARSAEREKIIVGAIEARGPDAGNPLVSARLDVARSETPEISMDPVRSPSISIQHLICRLISVWRKVEDFEEVECFLWRN